MEIEPSLQWIRQPIVAGNLVKGVERCLQRIEKASHNILKQRLIRELSDILRASQGGLTTREYARIREMIEAHSEVTAKLAAVDLTPSDAEVRSLTPEAGQTSCLFVVDGADAFGCVHELRVAPLPGHGSGIQLLNPQSDPEIPRTLIAANLALQRWLTTRGLTELGNQTYLTYDIPVEIGQITQAYEGNSIGLAGVVAILSGMLGQPVPSTYTFTGYVDIHGEIHRVGGIREKLQGAFEKGIATVFLPAATLVEVPERYRPIVMGVRTIGEVIERLFEPRQISAFIERLSGSALHAADHQEAFQGLSKGGEKVLISCIGERDPYGDPKFRQIAEGPVLTAFRKVWPRAVCLLTTATSGVFEAGKQTQHELRALVESSECEVELEQLKIHDPTAYDALVAEMGATVTNFLQALQQKLGRDTALEPYVVISSGTPQIHAVWVYLLNTEKLLRGARVLQVREPRFVPVGEERVREVVSRFLKIGRL